MIFDLSDTCSWIVQPADNCRRECCKCTVAIDLCDVLRHLQVTMENVTRKPKQLIIVKTDHSANTQTQVERTPQTELGAVQHCNVAAFAHSNEWNTFTPTFQM